jgi:hypothetical protein
MLPHERRSLGRMMVSAAVEAKTKVRAEIDDERRRRRSLEKKLAEAKLAEGRAVGELALADHKREEALASLKAQLAMARKGPDAMFPAAQALRVHVKEQVRVMMLGHRELPRLLEALDSDFDRWFAYAGLTPVQQKAMLVLEDAD